jgi:predicted metal-dependent hydrolase
VIAPLEVLEYVVVHELCHLRELNHSKRFYRLLEKARPGWRAEATWLREFGHELLEYRAA